MNPAIVINDMKAVPYIIVFLSYLTLTAVITHGAYASSHTIAEDRAAAVILTYHRVDEDEYPDTNIQFEQFESHIRELIDDPYNITPLSDIVAALKSDNSLPPQTIALTFDGGYRSILDKAVPLLLKHDIPFTVFIAPEHLNRKNSSYMNEADLKKLAKNKLVTVGLHPASYTRLTNQPDAEIRRQINSARARLRDDLRIEPSLFAYPFGEYDTPYREVISDAGFDAAFGQQSGVIYGGSDLYALPRFSMTENYAGLSRFRMIATALPLPAKDIEPHDPHLTTRRPEIGFTISTELEKDINRISCFISGQGKIDAAHAGNNRIELRPQSDFDTDRVRVNCTLPVINTADADSSKWRWFGMLMTTPPHQTAE